MFSKRNYCIKGIILYISFHSQTGKYYFKRGKNLLNLSVQDLQSEWVKKGTIRFSIITDYILDAKINWHIYKNGGHYYHEFGVNKFILEYTFKEEGTYTAMFYAEGIGGDGAGDGAADAGVCHGTAPAGNAAADHCPDHPHVGGQLYPI